MSGSCLITSGGCVICFVFKQTTAYEMRISDWSSDVCSSDLADILLDDHRSRADHIDIVALFALGQHDLARGHALDFGGVANGAKSVDCQAALEDLEQLAFERDAVDRTLGARNRSHPTERRGAGYLDEESAERRVGEEFVSTDKSWGEANK